MTNMAIIEYNSTIADSGIGHTGKEEKWKRQTKDTKPTFRFWKAENAILTNMAIIEYNSTIADSGIGHTGKEEKWKRQTKDTKPTFRF